MDSSGQFYVADKNGNAIPISREELVEGGYLIDTNMANAENMGYTSGLRTADAMNTAKANAVSAALSGLKAAAEEQKKKNNPNSVWSGRD